MKGVALVLGCRETHRTHVLWKLNTSLHLKGVHNLKGVNVLLYPASAGGGWGLLDEKKTNHGYLVRAASGPCSTPPYRRGWSRAGAKVRAFGLQSLLNWGTFLYRCVFPISHGIGAKNPWHRGHPAYPNVLVSVDLSWHFKRELR